MTKKKELEELKKRGRKPLPPSLKVMIKDRVPMRDIFDDDELSLYNDLVGIYLSDFEDEDLTSSDMDDIIDLAKNRVLEFRLLKKSKEDIDDQIACATTIEKLSKKNDKIKENLQNRRRDRFDPNDIKGMSIVDLVIAYDEEKKTRLDDQIKQMNSDQKRILKSRQNYHGNKLDEDSIGN